jgi:hypothetical protein
MSPAYWGRAICNASNATEYAERAVSSSDAAETAVSNRVRDADATARVTAGVPLKAHTGVGRRRLAKGHGIVNAIFETPAQRYRRAEARCALAPR